MKFPKNIITDNYTEIFRKMRGEQRIFPSVEMLKTAIALSSKPTSKKSSQAGARNKSKPKSEKAWEMTG